MNYAKVYFNLVDSRKLLTFQRSNDKTLRYEKHHIIPRCLSGPDTFDNIVLFTVREHILAHRLLCKIFPTEVKLHYALFSMLRSTRYNNRELTTRQASTIRNAHKEFQKNLWLTNNPMFLTKNKIAASNRMKLSNPLKLEPWKNHTVKPVKVIYLDGSSREYRMLKDTLSVDNKPVPYPTLKLLKRNKKSSKKHGIERIDNVN